MLIQRGANLNSRGRYNRVPLWRAAFGGHIQAVQVFFGIKLNKIVEGLFQSAFLQPFECKKLDLVHIFLCTLSVCSSSNGYNKGKKNNYY